MKEASTNKLKII